MPNAPSFRRTTGSQAAAPPICARIARRSRRPGAVSTRLGTAHTRRPSNRISLDVTREASSSPPDVSVRPTSKGSSAALPGGSFPAVVTATGDWVGDAPAEDGAGVELATGPETAVGPGVRVGVAAGLADGLEVRVGAGVGVGALVGRGVDLGVGFGVGLGVGLGVGGGVGVGAGVGVPATMATVTESVSMPDLHFSSSRDDTGHVYEPTVVPVTLT
jgi:hypothetical protein